jgi:hypothetical protein
VCAPGGCWFWLLLLLPSHLSFFLQPVAISSGSALPRQLALLIICPSPAVLQGKEDAITCGMGFATNSAFIPL